MNWFDGQIKARKRRDRENFADAMEELSSILTGEKAVHDDAASREARQANITLAIGLVLHHYHIKPGELPDDVKDVQDQLEYLCRPHGIMRRTVVLERGWYKDAVGAFLARRRDGTTVALLPNRFSGYSCCDPAAGTRVRVTRKLAAELEESAVCFYKPFPGRRMNVPDLLRYLLECVPAADYLRVLGVLLLTTLVGLLWPKVTHLIFQQVVPGGTMQLFWAVLIFAACLSISALLLQTLKMLLDNRINTQLRLSVQAATMARILSLPTEFFKSYSAGELTTKIRYFNALCADLYTCVMVTGLGSVFSLLYITQVVNYAPTLLVPSLCITAATLGVSLLNTILRMKVDRQAMEAEEKKNGLTYALIAGIQKIKISGSEQRAFTRWARTYAREVRNTYGLPLGFLLSGPIAMGISLLGTIVLYYFAVETKVSVADYYAFTAAYGVVSGAFSALVDMGIQAAGIRPKLDQVRPILEASPEIAADKSVVTKVRGCIELNNVSFRYQETMPWVLDDLSLKIQPGQYVAIVGKTGCGKSTLLRLLLGFETPQKGAVYYDNRDLESLDLRSLRQKIGVVMQNGKLFHGDIFSNIVISAPWLSLEDAWRAAERADIADDIRAMPMGMHTIIAEGGGGMSGGQRQRLMIARALAPEPKILMFDEATSALDNITQKKVSEALDGLNCTRIVIAHRLSTIRRCDRIIVLDAGKIVEDGTYEQLMEQKGLFAELVERQRVEQ